MPMWVQDTFVILVAGAICVALINLAAYLIDTLYDRRIRDEEARFRADKLINQPPKEFNFHTTASVLPFKRSSRGTKKHK